MPGQREAEHHRLIAGDLSLDFANTLNGHMRPGGHEYLHDYQDLILWCRHADLLSNPETRRLMEHAQAKESQARETFRRSLALREGIFRTFHAVARGRAPAPGDIAILNASWQEGQRHTCIVRRGSKFSLLWDDDPILARIPRALSAAAIRMLASDKIGLVRVCAGDDCDWLFLDDSRNHLRRWCSMDECGNRAKMRRRSLRGRGAKLD
jgi:predicted RNA-binding Zn ribbon-like protein